MNNLDQLEIEDFTNRMNSVLKDASTALLLSLGNRLNLLDIVSNHSPSTSEEIATEANLNHRYVLEWLNGLVTANIIDYFPENKTYSLSAEKSMVITSNAGLDNLAFFMRTLPPLASLEDEIVESFVNGGGVPYTHPNGRTVLKIFNEWTEEKWDTDLIDVTIPLIPDLKRKLQAGARVLDLGCGYGHSTNLMARHFPNSQFVGYDIGVLGIQKANKEKEENGLTNVEFKVQNVELMDEERSYDIIIAFDSIHDQAKPDLVLANIFKSLKDDGLFIMVDIKASSHVEENITHPIAPWLYTVSLFHCMTVSLANEGMGLGSMWGKQKAIEMLNNAGFTKINVEEPENDPFNFVYVCRK